MLYPGSVVPLAMFFLYPWIVEEIYFHIVKLFAVSRPSGKDLFGKMPSGGHFSEHPKHLRYLSFIFNTTFIHKY